jgi:hypothetical protein
VPVTPGIIPTFFLELDENPFSNPVDLQDIGNAAAAETFNSDTDWR